MAAGSYLTVKVQSWITGHPAMVEGLMADLGAIRANGYRDRRNHNCGYIPSVRRDTRGPSDTPAREAFDHSAWNYPTTPRPIWPLWGAPSLGPAATGRRTGGEVPATLLMGIFRHVLGHGRRPRKGHGKGQGHSLRARDPCHRWCFSVPGVQPPFYFPGQERTRENRPNRSSRIQFDTAQLCPRRPRGCRSGVG
jgi:hypothetical protein